MNSLSRRTKSVVLVSLAGNSFVFFNRFEESHTLPCSRTYQTVNCFMLQILLKLDIFAHVVICLNAANESFYAQESSTVYACSNHWQLEAKKLKCV